MTKTAAAKKPEGKVRKVVLLLTPKGKRKIVDDTFGTVNRVAS